MRVVFFFILSRHHRSDIITSGIFPARYIQSKIFSAHKSKLNTSKYSSGSFLSWDATLQLPHQTYPTAPHSPSSLPAVISTSNNGGGMPSNQMQSDSSSPFRACRNYNSVCFHFILLQINDFRLWQKHLSSLVLLSWCKNQLLRSTDGKIVFIEQYFAAGQMCAGGWMSNQMRSK